MGVQISYEGVEESEEMVHKPCYALLGEVIFFFIHFLKKFLFVINTLKFLYGLFLSYSPSPSSSQIQATFLSQSFLCPFSKQ